MGLFLRCRKRREIIFAPIDGGHCPHQIFEGGHCPPSISKFWALPPIKNLNSASLGGPPSPQKVTLRAETQVGQIIGGQVIPKMGDFRKKIFAVPSAPWKTFFFLFAPPWTDLTGTSGEQYLGHSTDSDPPKFGGWGARFWARSSQIFRRRHRLRKF